MSKKLTLTAVFATALALAAPATSAFARGGGDGGYGGGGHVTGFGSGPMDGGFAGVARNHTSLHGRDSRRYLPREEGSNDSYYNICTNYDYAYGLACYPAY
jgi:hypothetical protein